MYILYIHHLWWFTSHSRKTVNVALNIRMQSALVSLHLKIFASWQQVIKNLGQKYFAILVYNIYNLIFIISIMIIFKYCFIKRVRFKSFFLS